MTDKQQIERLKEALYKYARAYGKSFESAYGEYTVARTLVDFGILPLLLPENAVVLTQEELEDMVKAKMKCINDMAIITRKETVKQFAEKLKQTLIINNEENTEFFDYQYTLETIDEITKQYGVEVEE